MQYFSRLGKLTGLDQYTDHIFILKYEYMYKLFENNIIIISCYVLQSVTWLCILNLIGFRINKNIIIKF